jgi:hypothetical protein
MEVTSTTNGENIMKGDTAEARGTPEEQSIIPRVPVNGENPTISSAVVSTGM